MDRLFVTHTSQAALAEAPETTETAQEPPHHQRTYEEELCAE